MSASDYTRPRSGGINPAWTREAKGPRGRGLCMWCMTEVAGRRVNWCSDACVKLYRCASDWGVIRAQVRKRDGELCRLCGCEPLAPEYDHIVPLRDGGAFGAENVRLLCHECHVRVTTEWRRNRRPAARAARAAQPAKEE